MFQEYDRLCCLLCVAWTAVHAVSTKPCSMQQDKRSTLCALYMKTSYGVFMACALHLDLWN